MANFNSALQKRRQTMTVLSEHQKEVEDEK